MEVYIISGPLIIGTNSRTCLVPETLETRLSGLQRALYCASLHHFRPSAHWKPSRGCDSVEGSGKQPTSDSVEASSPIAPSRNVLHTRGALSRTELDII